MLKWSKNIFKKVGRVDNIGHHKFLFFFKQAQIMSIQHTPSTNRIANIVKYVDTVISMENAVNFIATHTMAPNRNYTLLFRKDMYKYVESNDELHTDLQHDLTHSNVLSYGPVDSPERNVYMFAFAAGTYVRKGQTMFFIEIENMEVRPQ